MELNQSADEEENIHSHSEANSFDTIIGEIEDIIMDASFRTLEREFVERHCALFDPASEENRLEWMGVFREYGRLLEGHLDSQLRQRLPSFSMDQFLTQLAERREELDGDIFDLLLSFSDFSSFKEMMLDYRRFKDGNVPCLDGIITSVQLPG
ncbi:ADP-ribosylation factor-like protein 2-binding protein [Amphibalanus amphitrite]|uniref:ADP-ribosylation factor-like protein 2-binding protein n=1 Tax=Amphibalanus amphitrite TaxID=1232801 RepID=UPI001C901BA1|nr:ADP-ribosylation factor-like protein 2-binding protein [Amphibalanus amphitrite]XP_043225382.1 ADP-ribosylation factor-like protein 2-binding protein [Amphibalanus amphitrite]